MTKNNKNRAGSEVQYGPRMRDGIYPDTHLGVTLKTILRSERQVRAGKPYRGVLLFEQEGYADAHCYHDARFVFLESVYAPVRRNEHLFEGRYITITCRDDGSPRLNFRNLPQEMSVDSYAIGVCDEIREALTGLVGEGGRLPGNPET